MVLYKSGKTVVCEASHIDIKVLVKWWKEKIFLSFFCKVRGKLLQNWSFQGGHHGDMVSFIKVRE